MSSNPGARTIVEGAVGGKKYRLVVLARDWKEKLNPSTLAAARRKVGPGASVIELNTSWDDNVRVAVTNFDGEGLAEFLEDENHEAVEGMAPPVEFDSISDLSTIVDGEQARIDQNFQAEERDDDVLASLGTRGGDLVKRVKLELAREGITISSFYNHPDKILRKLEKSGRIPKGRNWSFDGFCGYIALHGSAYSADE